VVHAPDQHHHGRRRHHRVYHCGWRHVYILICLYSADFLSVSCADPPLFVVKYIISDIVCAWRAALLWNYDRRVVAILSLFVLGTIGKPRLLFHLFGYTPPPIGGVPDPCSLGVLSRRGLKPWPGPLPALPSFFQSPVVVRPTRQQRHYAWRRPPADSGRTYARDKLFVHVVDRAPSVVRGVSAQAVCRYSKREAAPHAGENDTL
jgi:hypothetical protein